MMKWVNNRPTNRNQHDILPPRMKPLSTENCWARSGEQEYANPGAKNLDLKFCLIKL